MDTHTQQRNHFQCCTHSWWSPSHGPLECCYCRKSVEKTPLEEVIACGLFSCKTCNHSWSSLAYNCMLSTIEACAGCGTWIAPLTLCNISQRKRFMDNVQVPNWPSERPLGSCKSFICTKCKHEFFDRWVSPVCFECNMRDFVNVVMCGIARTPVWKDNGTVRPPPILLRCKECNTEIVTNDKQLDVCMKCLNNSALMYFPLLLSPKQYVDLAKIRE